MQPEVRVVARREVRKLSVLPTDTLTLTSSFSGFLQSRIGTLGLLYRGMPTPLFFINN